MSQRSAPLSALPSLIVELHDAEDGSAGLQRFGFSGLPGRRAPPMKRCSIRSGMRCSSQPIDHHVPVDARLNDELELRRLVRVDDVIADIQPAVGSRMGRACQR
jgi:hypothetical protein